jgi:hypothetical protein
MLLSLTVPSWCLHVFLNANLVEILFFGSKKITKICLFLRHLCYRFKTVNLTRHSRLKRSFLFVRAIYFFLKFYFCKSDLKCDFYNTNRNFNERRKFKNHSTTEEKKYFTVLTIVILLFSFKETLAFVTKSQIELMN